MRLILGLVAAAMLLAVPAAFAQDSQSSPASPPGYGYGPMMGPGMMGGYGMGPGMMGYGMMGGYGTGPGAMGPGMMDGYGMGPAMMGWGRGNLNLSTDDVKTYFSRWLQWNGNSRLKLGAISARDSNTITVDIVTTDKDGLVSRYDVDRHSGFMRQEG